MLLDVNVFWTRLELMASFKSLFAIGNLSPGSSFSNYFIFQTSWVSAPQHQVFNSRGPTMGLELATKEMTFEKVLFNSLSFCENSDDENVFGILTSFHWRLSPSN